MENSKGFKPLLEPETSRRSQVSPLLMQIGIFWQVSAVLLNLIFAAFSRRSRNIILSRARNKSELTGRTPTMANRMHAAHKTRTQWLERTHPEYDNPDHGIALLQSEHARQHIELAEVAQTLGDVYRNVEAAELVLRGWKANAWEAVERYGADASIRLLPEWQPLELTDRKK